MPSTDETWTHRALPVTHFRSHSAYAGSTQHDWVQQKQLCGIRPGHVLFLPKREVICPTSTIHSQISENDKEWFHPVIVKTVVGGKIEFFVTSSFSDGKTVEDLRPSWYPTALPILHSKSGTQTGSPPQLPSDGAQPMLELEGRGLSMDKNTFVRTDRTYQIEGTKLQYWNFHKRHWLNRTSVQILEERYLQQASSVSGLGQTSRYVPPHQRNGTSRWASAGRKHSA